MSETSHTELILCIIIDKLATLCIYFPSKIKINTIITYFCKVITLQLIEAFSLVFIS